MKLCNINHTFDYETEKLCRLFLPFERIDIFHTKEADDRLAVTVLEPNKAEAHLTLNGQTMTADEPIEPKADDKAKELAVATALFSCFCTLTGYHPKWGLLTGVRPGKLYARLCEDEGQRKARAYFTDKLFVSEEKLSLCTQCHTQENAIVSLSHPDSFSLYLAIPFCPTRCSYCSFVSHSIEKATDLVQPYVDLLCREIKETAAYAIRHHLRLETVYMGGGTPTTLSASQLTQVLNTVRNEFDCSFLREFTVEAGRPDTITKEKILALKQAGVDRISINPQTMNDEVLRAIGRRHTAAQTVEAFRVARECGMNHINMDLIAGLPGDDPASFRRTIGTVLALDPEAVTVHALSMKRASTLTAEGVFPEIERGKEADIMVSYAREALEQHGLFPYYLYRQSKTVGNLENTGYAKPGKAGYYNVYIMDETHTVLGCGASAVTKLRQPDGPYIERIFNFKYPYEYINRYDELLERKKGIDVFYQTYWPDTFTELSVTKNQD